MRLDRNTKGRGKYALIKQRRLDELEPDTAIDSALRVLDDAGVIDWGVTPETEFFVMRLKDRYARVPLHAYAAEAHRSGDLEYASEVDELAMRAGVHSPFCKKPD